MKIICEVNLKKLFDKNEKALQFKSEQLSTEKNEESRHQSAYQAYFHSNSSALNIDLN